MNSMVEFYQPQADFGTPESKSDATVTLMIDGREVTVAEGTSVMRLPSKPESKCRNCARQTASSLLARAEFVWLRLKVDAVTLVMHHAC